MSLLRLAYSLLAQMASASPRRAAIAAVLTLAVAATEWIGVVLLIPLLQLVGIGSGTEDTMVAKWFADAFAAIGLVPTLEGALAFYVAVAGIRSVLIRAQVNLNTELREGLTLTLRERLYRAIGGAEWRFLVTRRPSEFAHVLAKEVTRLGGVAFAVVGLAISSIIAVAYVALTFGLFPVVSMIVVTAAGGMGWVSMKRLVRAKELGKRAMLARKDLHALIFEHVASMKTAKSYGAGKRHSDAFSRLAGDLRKVTLEQTADQTGLKQNLDLSWTVLLAVIVFVAHRLVGASPAHLLVVLFICMRLMPRIMSIMRQAHGLGAVLPVIEAVEDLERELLENAEQTEAVEAKFSLEEGIVLDRVGFSYLRRTEPVLMDMNLEIKAGLTSAVVGASGAGKSTLADVLIGLLTPTSGQILVDGRTLTAGARAAWREEVAYVPQDTFLFHDTVRQNLLWSQPDATEAAIWEALRLAAADEFVRLLPDQLDTIIGERGVLLSGGERQRLSLARALLRSPRVLVLDEATSSLDSETERRIQGAIELLHQRMTIVIVTHRLSMISGADVIHVLDRGRLVESGTWEELLLSPVGRFRELCLAQGITERPTMMWKEGQPA